MDSTDNATVPEESPLEALASGGKRIYVYEAPVRLWHWINALSVIVLAVTGYLIGSPPPSVTGEASDHYILGTIRFIHFSAGYVFAIGFLGRILWALFGNRYSRELFTLPVFRKKDLENILSEIRWYLFLERRPHMYAGHNPLAQVMMFFFVFLTSLFMIATGFALYGEGLQAGSWADRMFGWVVVLMGQPQTVHTLHHLGMWVLMVFVIFHVYFSIREEIMSRQSMIGTIVNGYRNFRQ